MKNPYSLTFGMRPKNFIERSIEIGEVIETFDDVNPSCNLFMISGIRGSGKTVTMTNIEDHFRNEKEWIVIDLNPELNLMNEFAAQLSSEPLTMQILKDAKINLSFLGLGVEIDGVPPITSVTVAIDRMLEKLAKKGKRILITIDEVTNTENVRTFASQFQIFIRKQYPVYMIMTGLYENIYDIQNEKSLTFLYRAPKIKLNPLNLDRIAINYRDVFGIEIDKAKKMAQFTKGYSYAFQVLGYVCAKTGRPYEDVMDEFDLYMAEYVYDKIWSELSPTDKATVVAISKSDNGKTKNVRELSGQTSNQYNKYRTRLIEKEIIRETSYGFVDFTLPRFREYALSH